MGGTAENRARWSHLPSFEQTAWLVKITSQTKEKCRKIAEPAVDIPKPALNWCWRQVASEDMPRLGASSLKQGKTSVKWCVGHKKGVVVWERICSRTSFTRLHHQGKNLRGPPDSLNRTPAASENVAGAPVAQISLGTPRLPKAPRVFRMLATPLPHHEVPAPPRDFP